MLVIFETRSLTGEMEDGKSLKNETWPSGFAAAITVLSISKCIIISSWYFRCFTHNYTQSGFHFYSITSKIRNCHNIQEIFQPWSLNLECNIDIALLLMAPPARSNQNKQANFKTISDQEGLMLDITSRDLLSWLDSETTKQLSQTHHPDNDINQDIVFKLVEDLHVIVEPLPTEAALAQLGGTDHGLRLDPRVQRGELRHLVETEFWCSWQKLVLEENMADSYDANSSPFPLVPPPPALPWGRRASFWAAFWLRGNFEEPNLMRTLF